MPIVAFSNNLCREALGWKRLNQFHNAWDLFVLVGSTVDPIMYGMDNINTNQTIQNPATYVQMCRSVCVLCERV